MAQSANTAASSTVNLKWRVVDIAVASVIGVASALIDEALAMLSKQGVPHLIGRCVRRNQSAVKMFRRSGFDWVRTECYLLGRDL